MTPPPQGLSPSAAPRQGGGNEHAHCMAQACGAGNGGGLKTGTFGARCKPTQADAERKQLVSLQRPSRLLHAPGTGFPILLREARPFAPRRATPAEPEPFLLRQAHPWLRLGPASWLSSTCRVLPGTVRRRRRRMKVVGAGVRAGGVGEKPLGVQPGALVEAGAAVLGVSDMGKCKHLLAQAPLGWVRWGLQGPALGSCPVTQMDTACCCWSVLQRRHGQVVNAAGAGGPSEPHCVKAAREGRAPPTPIRCSQAWVPAATPEPRAAPAVPTAAVAASRSLQRI